MFSTPEQMQIDYEGCRRGVVPEVPSFGFQIPTVLDAELAPPGKHAASAFAFYFPVTGSRDEQSELKDVMAQRVVERIASIAPNFPDVIDRQMTYASYAYEMMFGCTDGDFCHGLIHPELMGPFRPGPRGWIDLPIPIAGLYLSSAGCHGGPGITFIPGYNCGYEVLETADADARSDAASV
jgi:phytoene dehydrogenase-like protein